MSTDFQGWTANQEDDPCVYYPDWCFQTIAWQDAQGAHYQVLDGRHVFEDMLKERDLRLPEWIIFRWP